MLYNSVIQYWHSTKWRFTLGNTSEQMYWESYYHKMNESWLITIKVDESVSKKSQQYAHEDDVVSLKDVEFRNNG